MNKLHFQSDQEELIRVAGQMVSLIEGSSHVKSAASNTMTREMLADAKPDKNHFLLHVIAMGDHEHYGCFFAGTPVQTSEGQKSIEDVKVGDWALTQNNRYRPVTQLFEASYTGNAVRIKCTGLPEAEEATADHPYKVIRKEAFTVDRRAPSRFKHRGSTPSKEQLIDRLVGEAVEVRADQVKPGDFMIVPVGASGGKVLPDDLAGPAGFYLAEGCVIDESRNIVSKGMPKGCVFVVNTRGDESRVQELRDYQTAAGLKLRVSESPSSEFASRVEFCNQEFSREVVRLVGRHSTTKRIHPDIFAQSLEWKLRFLAAYFDGDGCLITEASKPRYENVLTASTASRNLACDVQRLLANCGIPSSVNKSFNKESNGCFGSGDFPIYSVAVGGSCSPLVLQYTTRLKARRVVTRQGGGHTHTSGNYLLVPVHKVEVFTVIARTKFNFEVAGDHTYVTNVLSHNSNRNGDAWPKKACDTYHNTFVTHGHYFREHRNRDPKQAIGSIKASCFNKDMGRIELAVHGHIKKAEDIFEAARAGKPTSFSMSARVPYDRSSITGKLARTPADYDEYTKYRMNQWIPEHRKFAFVYNDHPTFFDISSVRNPADRIAHSLEYVMPEEFQKAASADGVVNGYELARLIGVTLPDNRTGCADPSRQVLLEKLAAMECYLDAVDQGTAATDAQQAFCKHSAVHAFRGELSEPELAAFKSIEPGTLFRKLAEAQVVLPWASFAAYASGKTIAEVQADPEVSGNDISHVFSDLTKAACSPELETTFEPASAFMSAADLRCTPEVEAAVKAAALKFGTHSNTLRQRVLENSAQFDKRNAQAVTTKQAALTPLAMDYAHYKLAAVEAIAQLTGNDDAAQNVLVVTQNRYRS